MEINPKPDLVMDKDRIVHLYRYIAMLYERHGYIPVDVLTALEDRIEDLTGKLQDR